VVGGEYIGSKNPINEMWGYPAVCKPRRAARDPEVAKRLWQVSEQRTGVRYEILA
jgi:hypothetical protein